VHYELKIYKSFEDWLNLQQSLSVPEKDTWLSFLSSYEDLIRRQAMLLDSFEMLAKTHCSGGDLVVNKEATIDGNQEVTYKYTVTAKLHTEDISLTDSLLGTLWEGKTLDPADVNHGVNITYRGPMPLTCHDCKNCTCKVCNFATICGKVFTSEGNFTFCNISNEVCMKVDYFPGVTNQVTFGGVRDKLTYTTVQPAQGPSITSEAINKEMNSSQTKVDVTKSVEVTAIDQNKNNGRCLTCEKK
jgi:hypothetical protein